MTNQILVPALGESVTEATVSKWLKQVGEEVDSDEPLVELETDKLNIEGPSPFSVTLTSITVKEGGVAEVGALLGIVKDEQSSSTIIDKEENRQQKKYVPPITAEKKNINKKSKKTHLEKQKPLKLVDTVEEGSEK